MNKQELIDVANLVDRSIKRIIERSKEMTATKLKGELDMLATQIKFLISEIQL